MHSAIARQETAGCLDSHMGRRQVTKDFRCLYPKSCRNRKIPFRNGKKQQPIVCCKKKKAHQPSAVLGDCELRHSGFSPHQKSQFYLSFCRSTLISCERVAPAHDKSQFYLSFCRSTLISCERVAPAQVKSQFYLSFCSVLT